MGTVFMRDVDDEDDIPPGYAPPRLAPALRVRAYMYSAALFAEVVLIVGCFCWMSEAAPCKVAEDASEDEKTKRPCDEATYLFFIFYLGLAKDLAFFLLGLKTEDAADDSVSSLFTQFLAILAFFGLTSGVAAVLYLLQPTESFIRKIVYAAGGAGPNLAVVCDCIVMALTSWRRGYRAIFPDVEEVKPFKYSELRDSTAENTWHLKECTICLAEFEHDDNVMRLPCGHLFHTDCVVGWLKSTMRCPVRCRLGHFVVSLPHGASFAGISRGDEDDDLEAARQRRAAAAAAVGDRPPAAGAAARRGAAGGDAGGLAAGAAGGAAGGLVALPPLPGAPDDGDDEILYAAPPPPPPHAAGIAAAWVPATAAGPAAAGAAAVRAAPALGAAAARIGFASLPGALVDVGDDEIITDAIVPMSLKMPAPAASSRPGSAGAGALGGASSSVGAATLPVVGAASSKSASSSSVFSWVTPTPGPLPALAPPVQRPAASSAAAALAATPVPVLGLTSSAPAGLPGSYRNEVPPVMFGVPDEPTDVTFVD